MSLRSKRQSLGLLQEDVAKRAGIALTTYSNYETGKRRIPASVKSKLVEILGIVDEAEFFLPSCYAIRGM